MIRITPTLALDDRDLHTDFIRAAGPGGQNVNKVATAVQLRFDLHGVTPLPAEARARLEKLAGSRLTTEGVIVIEARRYRTQEQNRQDAEARMAALVLKALVRPRTRRPTRPTASARAERVEHKKVRGATKRQRQVKARLDE